jgi:hypothetical protein
VDYIDGQPDPRRPVCGWKKPPVTSPGQVTCYLRGTLSLAVLEAAVLSRAMALEDVYVLISRTLNMLQPMAKGFRLPMELWLPSADLKIRR